jgi:hypothetical protein
MRAAILAAAMNLTPVAAVDILRFLRVPAIVRTIGLSRGRACRDSACQRVARKPRSRRQPATSN